MCKCQSRTPRLPDFSKWTLQRLVAQARRFKVPQLNAIVSQQPESMARHELINILSDAWS